MNEEGGGDNAFLNLLGNVASYALLVVPVALLVRHYQDKPEKLQGNDLLSSFARGFILGRANGPPSPSKANGGGANNKQASHNDSEQPGDVAYWKSVALLVFFVVGLQVSYLAWGVLQEQMMTQAYGYDSENKPIRFLNSQYLVFLNRCLAFFTALLLVTFTTQPIHTAPLYKYSFPSMSNILSSWCQYEALKYVGFPTQVLAKATKTIPVMLMGKFVDGQTYPRYEYISAIILSLGTAMFLFSRSDAMDEDTRATTLTGAAMLLGYMVFDSFTSNYQSAVFKQHGVSEYQMMLGVNLFSSVFCIWSLIQRGELWDCIDFTVQYPKFFWHSILLSVTSATGQIFIFHTIARYGPLVFTIIMTTRQAFSVFLSAIIFHHNLGSLAWGGILVVFASLFYRVYNQAQSKKGGKKNGNSGSGNGGSITNGSNVGGGGGVGGSGNGNGNANQRA